MKKQNDFRRGNENRTQKTQAGFSLIEMLIIVVILGIIASIAIARFQAAVKKANEASAVSALKIILNSQAAHRTSNDAPATFDELINSKAIDEGFTDGDGDDRTAARNGYKYLITQTGNTYILSAIPQTTGAFGSGLTRLGSSEAGTIYKDDNNLDTHYTTAAELTAGTSVPYEQN